MTEVLEVYRIGNRARVPDELLEESITDTQRTELAGRIDSLIASPLQVVTVSHEHRARPSTDIATGGRRYAPPGYKVECTQKGDLREATIASRKNTAAGIDRETEMYAAVFPDSPKGDHFDEISIDISTRTGEPIPEIPRVILVPEKIDEMLELQRKEGLYNLTQGRWQTTMDILDLCDESNRVV